MDDVKFTATIIWDDRVDEVAVGDLNSSERGSGARKNKGKPEYHQLPWWVVKDLEPWVIKVNPVYNPTSACISHMSRWQRGEEIDLVLAGAEAWVALAQEQQQKPSYMSLIPVVRVLEFGAKKYAKGNWAKGMSWSVVFDCTMSHLTKAHAGLKNDAESGLSHLAHAMCNILFLLAYRDLYPEGDDRIKEFRVTPKELRPEGEVE